MTPLQSPPTPLPLLLLLLFLLTFILLQTLKASAQNPSPSQIKTLFRLQRILEYPPSLSPLTNATTICSIPSSSSLSITCLGNRIVELSIHGGGGGRPSNPLSSAFSVDSLFTTISKLPNLTALSLVSLGIWGPLPLKIDRLSPLKALNLSSNSLNGTLANLKSLSSINELDLSKNRFSGDIPLEFASFDKLQRLDLSLNQLNGKIPPFFFSLHSIQYLDLSRNRFVGDLPMKVTCGDMLRFADISSNLLVGRLPSCISFNSSTRVVFDSWNCLSSGDSRFQHPSSYCAKDPLAAVLPPLRKDERSKSNIIGVILGIVGGVIGGFGVLVFVVLLVLRKARSESVEMVKLPKPVGKVSVQISTRPNGDTRHMSQAVRIGTLGLGPYRVFTTEELEEATNGFDSSNLISDAPRGKFYKGWLQDGSTIVVRCLKLKQRISPQSLNHYMDVISKLRHVNLVSILGHCIPNGPDNTVTNDTIYLALEYVSNGTLRSHLTEWRKREMLKWPQRVAAVIGVARGIQFLHTVTVPGIVGNDLGIENVLLDETLTAKISNYNLPILPKNKNNKVGSENPFSILEDNDRGSSLEHGEKEDVYQLGLILLEIITGKPAGSDRELEALKIELQNCLTDGPLKLREIADPTIRGTFAIDSLQTLVDVALNCVAKNQQERPSIDDILWNLQYSVQVQDGWNSS